MPRPTNNVLGRNVDSERMVAKPPASDIDSDVGENMAMIATRPMLKKTLMREVLARSAMSLCRHNGSITNKLEIIRHFPPGKPNKGPIVSFTNIRYDSIGPQDMMNIIILQTNHPI
mmetsp:Transcript_37762/g.68020  ORF Transcript_37762/g.68020 Transcript_37762/m.68020 type:complete len:116 (-) Transcript_37762:183-530(-)